jgi:AN1-type zinc finger protein 1
LDNKDDSDEKKLRIFHAKDGRVLGFEEKIGDAVVTGNIIILLRGLQVPELME